MGTAEEASRCSMKQEYNQTLRLCTSTSHLFVLLSRVWAGVFQQGGLVAWNFGEILIERSQQNKARVDHPMIGFANHPSTAKSTLLYLPKVI
jgi:hypothetical protein